MRLANLFQTYLDEEFRLHPLFATQQGNHEFDDQLDDLSPQARKKDVERTKAWLARLPKEIDFKKLSMLGPVDGADIQDAISAPRWLIDPNDWSVRAESRFGTDVLMELSRAGHDVKKAEVHGMSQRGGAVHACLTIAPFPISTPVIMEGTGDLLIALEPVEAIRYVTLLRRDAPMLVGRDPVKTVAGYPGETQLLAALRAVDGCEIIETAAVTRTARQTSP